MYIGRGERVAGSGEVDLAANRIGAEEKVEYIGLGGCIMHPPIWRAPLWTALLSPATRPFHG